MAGKAAERVIEFAIVAFRRISQIVDPCRTSRQGSGEASTGAFVHLIVSFEVDNSCFVTAKTTGSATRHLSCDKAVLTRPTKVPIRRLRRREQVEFLVERDAASGEPRVLSVPSLLCFSCLERESVNYSSISFALAASSRRAKKRASILLRLKCEMKFVVQFAHPSHSLASHLHQKEPDHCVPLTK